MSHVERQQAASCGGVTLGQWHRILIWTAAGMRADGEGLVVSLSWYTGEAGWKRVSFLLPWLLLPPGSAAAQTFLPFCTPQLWHLESKAEPSIAAPSAATLQRGPE